MRTFELASVASGASRLYNWRHTQTARLFELTIFVESRILAGRRCRALPDAGRALPHWSLAQDLPPIFPALRVLCEVVSTPSRFVTGA